jgi:hypothetical protein
MTLRTLPALLSIALFAPALAVAAPPTGVQCEITENGQPASGTVSVLREGSSVAEGSCGKPLALQPGSYEAVLRLDGAMDGPERRMPLEVATGKTTKLATDFATGVLEVKITSEGRAAAGMAILRKDGKQIGTLGSGVPGHLSVGTYDVVVRHRAVEKSFPAVVIARGERKTLEASF